MDVELDSDEDVPVPEEVLVVDGEGPITGIRDQFKEYCEAHPTKFRSHLTAGEKTSLKLLEVIFKKKTPLNAHRDLMEWHLQSSGELREGHPLKHCSGYVSREATMKAMRARYLQHRGQMPPF